MPLIILIHHLWEVMDLVTIYKTSDSFWKIKENDDTGWLLLESVYKIPKGNNALCVKVSQLLASQNTVKVSNELSDKIDQL